MNSEFRSLILHDSDPDFVVYQFNVNDLDPPGNPKKSPGDQLTLREKFEKVRLSYLSRSTFLKTVQAESMKVYLRSKHTDSTDSIRYSGKTDPNLYAHQWSGFESTLLDVRDTLTKRGIRFAILLVPEAIKISALEIDNEFHVTTSGISIWPGERVKEAAGRLNIPIIDSTSYLKAYREMHPSARLYFPNDANHPNYKGHQAIADAIISELPAISGCSR